MMDAFEPYETPEISEQPESYERADLERDFARRAEVEEITVSSLEETAIAVSDVPEEHTLDGIRELDPDRWPELSPEQCHEALQKAERSLAQAQGREAKPVRLEALPPNQKGYFDGEQITINEQLVQGDDVRQAVTTLTHEGRHAYQRYAVEHPEIHGDQAEVKQWQENFAHYKNPQRDGFRAYYNQPVEVDARDYAQRVVNARYGRS
jgi:hypothetical protein